MALDQRSVTSILAPDASPKETGAGNEHFAAPLLATVVDAPPSEVTPTVLPRLP